MTIQDLRDRELILYECISGSRAYGLELPSSDTDIKGVFLLPKEMFYGLEYIPQVSNATNDEVFYELGRFIELLEKNNPNILELLATPKDKILYKHPLLDQIDPAVFLSKRCKDTFGGYALTQVKKARGLNKKIVNPMNKQKKTIMDFCYVLHQQGSVPLQQWLEQKNIQQDQCGLVKIPHAKDLYGIFVDHQHEFEYKGILRKNTGTTILLSSIPKGELPEGYLYFNQDGFVKYCKDYKEYWSWVEHRNPARYQDNIEHGKNYDSKNMMHTFRLLDMAKEILSTGEIHVKRPNRETLLSIRKGTWDYDDLMEEANRKMHEIEAAYATSKLPEKPNKAAIQKLLVNLRIQFYEQGSCNAE